MLKKKKKKKEWLVFSIFGLLEGSALQYKTPSKKFSCEHWDWITATLLGYIQIIVWSDPDMQ